MVCWNPWENIDNCAFPMGAKQGKPSSISLKFLSNSHDFWHQFFKSHTEIQALFHTVYLVTSIYDVWLIPPLHAIWKNLFLKKNGLLYCTLEKENYSKSQSKSTQIIPSLNYGSYRIIILLKSIQASQPSPLSVILCHLYYHCEATGPWSIASLPSRGTAAECNLSSQEQAWLTHNINIQTTALRSHWRKYFTPWRSTRPKDFGGQIISQGNQLLR